jgi:hypothetical protein
LRFQENNIVFVFVPNRNIVVKHCKIRKTTLPVKQIEADIF